MKTIILCVGIVLYVALVEGDYDHKPGDYNGKPVTCPDANEEYRTCPSNCPPTCETLDNPVMCTMDCRLPAQCQCKNGYVRNGKGACVLPKQCPKRCTDPNEEFKECPSNCPPTCENWRQKVVCTKECRLPGKCQCKAGYVRNSKGACVRPKECPIIDEVKCSGPNEEYSTCLSSCPSTCDNWNKDIMCTMDCKPPGCQCKQGHVRNHRGVCVHTTECTNAPSYN